MSQKAENLLNLALDATSEEREKSLELEVGYQPLDQEWDLIIKYSGNLEAVREIASSVTELSNSDCAGIPDRAVGTDSGD